MSEIDHQETREEIIKVLVEVQKSLLSAELKSSEKYIEVVMELTKAIQRFDEKYETRLNDLERSIKSYVRLYS